MIGGIIMTHGDDSGLVLPPAVAPIQVVIVPIAAAQAGRRRHCRRLSPTDSSGHGVRVKLDDSDNSPGWKFAEYEMKGVPLRIEIGPRDIAGKQVRHGYAPRSGEKTCRFARRARGRVSTRRLQDQSATECTRRRSRTVKRRSYDCRSIEEIKAKRSRQRGDGFVTRDVVRKRGVRGQGQGAYRARFALRSSRSEKDFGQVRLLRKARRQDGLLG